jgi:hypothetical protein
LRSGWPLCFAPALVASLWAFAASGRGPPPAAGFGIGGGETDPHTHVAIKTPRDLVRVSMRVTVDESSDKGLNFVALQVNFPNGTWAHGGLQAAGGPNPPRVHQVNWGGLVNRGGGAGDYQKEDPAADLEKMQDPPATQASDWYYDWKVGVTYELTIERGALVTLPAGDYRFSWKAKPVHVDHPRKMWEWRFTVRPVSQRSLPSFSSMLYDGAEAVWSMSVWNEVGYGASNDTLHTSWSFPSYRSIANATLGTKDAEGVATSYFRF